MFFKLRDFIDFYKINSYDIEKNIHLFVCIPESQVEVTLLTGDEDFYVDILISSFEVSFEILKIFSTRILFHNFLFTVKFARHTLRCEPVSNNFMLVDFYVVKKLSNITFLILARNISIFNFSKLITLVYLFFVQDLIGITYLGKTLRASQRSLLPVFIFGMKFIL